MLLLEAERSTLSIVDKALRESQRGYDPIRMAHAVFDALNIDPEAELAFNVRTIINRNLMDTNFTRMAEEVTAVIEGVGV